MTKDLASRVDEGRPQACQPTGSTAAGNYPLRSLLATLSGVEWIRVRDEDGGFYITCPSCWADYTLRGGHTAWCPLASALVMGQAVAAVDPAGELAKLTSAHARIKALSDLLQDCESYFDDKADVIDGSEGEPIANREMSLHARIRAVLAQVQG